MDPRAANETAVTRIACLLAAIPYFSLQPNEAAATSGFSRIKYWGATPTTTLRR
jgi:hypothetical protein